MNGYQWTYQQYGWTDLTDKQKQLFETIELDFLPLRKDLQRLLEAELSDDQIGKIFKSAQELSRDKNLKTGFGKAVAFPKETLIKVNRILDNFGKKLQDSEPVKNFDQRFEAIKASLRSKLEKSQKGKTALALVDSLGNMANGPRGAIYQAAVIGLLTAISGLALGPAAIPVVAFILRGATELVKGEKLSTAVGKAVKAGAFGYIGAQLASGLMEWFENLRIASITPVGPSELGIGKMTFSGRSVTNISGMEWTRSFRVADVTVDPAMRGAINDAILRMGTGDLGAYDRLLSLARKAVSPEYMSELSRKLGDATAAKINNDGFLASIRAIKDYVVAGAGGAATAATAAGEKPGEKPAASAEPAASPAPKVIPGAREPGRRREPTIEKRLALPILEGLWADLTLKFGAGKLMKAWQQAGRPTDSVEIAQMLADMGMETDDIKEVLSTAGMSDEDLDQTMSALASGNNDDDLDVPFTSGIKAFDDEAKKILKLKGKDEFVSYWENKLGELEKSVDDTDAPKPTDGESVEAKFKAAIDAEDADQAKSVISSAGSMSAEMKERLIKMVNDATMIPNEKRLEIANILDKATVAEMETFFELSKILSENKLTWKDLGYQLVIQERRTNSVILI